jgi:predicted aspartyl protease
VSEPFDPNHRLIVISVEVEGPSGSRTLRMALDTGASGTLIRASILESLGYDLTLWVTRVQLTTGSGVVSAPRIIVSRMVAFQEERLDWLLTAHELPPSATIDGLLGLDFFRGRVLTIDFVRGEIELT